MQQVGINERVYPQREQYSVAIGPADAGPRSARGPDGRAGHYQGVDGYCGGEHQRAEAQPLIQAPIIAGCRGRVTGGTRVYREHDQGAQHQHRQSEVDEHHQRG